jgi:hypothetical protein
MSAGDLDSRIAGALQRTKASPDDIAALLAEAERALADTERELAQANAQALDPTSTSAVIASARGVTFDAQFRLQRLVVARDRLREKHAAATERVAKEAREAAHADLVLRRDALAARFESTWREHAEPLAAFLHEIAAIDEEIGTANRLKPTTSTAAQRARARKATTFQCPRARAASVGRIEA